MLTNGTRLGDPQVQADLREADLVIPSLDAATSRAFNAICQPVQGIDVEAVIEGIASFREGYAGQLLLEVFIVPGINDGDEELRALKLAALRIKPDAIQLNSLDRPAAHSASIGVPRPEQLERVREYLSPLQVQTVRKRGAGEPAPWDNPECFRSILAALGHGDANLSRLAVATGIREGDLAKTLAQMAHQTLVEVDETTGVFRRNAPNLLVNSTSL